MSSVAVRFQSSLKGTVFVRVDCRLDRPKLPVARFPDGVLLKRKDSSPSIKLPIDRSAINECEKVCRICQIAYGDLSTMAKGFCFPSAPTALSSGGTAWSTIGILDFKFLSCRGVDRLYSLSFFVQKEFLLSSAVDLCFDGSS